MQTYKDKDGDVGQGHYISYYENGNKKEEGDETNGKVNGLIKVYRIDGTLERTAVFENDEHNGETVRYYPSGKIMYKARLKHGIYRRGKFYTPSGERTHYFEDKCCPEHPNGYKSFYDYTKANLRRIKDNGRLLTGKVEVDAFFNDKGKVDYMEFKKKPHPLLEAEVKRLILEMPVWGPALDDFGNPKEFSRELDVWFYY